MPQTVSQFILLTDRNNLVCRERKSSTIVLQYVHSIRPILCIKNVFKEENFRKRSSATSDLPATVTEYATRGLTATIGTKDDLHFLVAPPADSAHCCLLGRLLARFLFVARALSRDRH